MIDFLRDSWPIFLTLIAIFGLLGILLQLMNMAKLSNGTVEGLFARFGFAIVCIAFAGLNMLALIASVVIQIIEHTQSTGAT